MSKFASTQSINYSKCVTIQKVLSSNTTKKNISIGGEGGYVEAVSSSASTYVSRN